MKVLAVFVVLVALASADDWKIQTREDLLKYRDECMVSSNLPAANIEKIKAWDFPEDEVTKCYLLCVFEKMGLFSSETGFNVEHLTKQLSQHGNADEIKKEIESKIDHNTQKSSACEWLFRGFKSFLSKHLETVKKSVGNKA